KTSADEYWREHLVVPLDSLSVYVACSELKSINCTEYGQKISVKAISLPSFWGTCLALSTNFTVPYRGPFTCLTIKHQRSKPGANDDFANRILDVKTTVSGIQNSALLFYVRSDLSLNINHQLFYTALTVLEGFETHFGMSMKKFNLFNAKSEPCLETNHFTDCFNDCLNQHVSQISTKCRMPFVRNETLPVCDASNANEAYLQTYKNYLNFNYHSCICHQDCISTTYSTTSNVIDKLRDNSTTILQIFFTDDSYEYTKSRQAYGFPVMISDMGGINLKCQLKGENYNNPDMDFGLRTSSDQGTSP
uniref:Uncharacterized protein n=1 Tax=Strigamia maritima TaxID=126957 RepID=T1ISZ8_STRMM